MQWYSMFSTTHGFQLKNWFVGGGVGYYHSYRDKENMYPIYAAGRFTFEKTKLRPYIGVRAGIMYDPLWIEKVQKYGSLSAGLTIYQIEEIKNALKRNYDKYIQMRTDEWKERKRMTNNYQDNVQTQITLEAQKALDDTRKKEKEDIELLYLDNFNENVKAMEEQFNQRVNEYFAETKARLDKKKPKKKKKKK